MWRAGHATGFDVPLGWPQYRSAQNGVDAVSIVSGHEFGHVLGVADAYKEWYADEAPLSKAPEFDIMRSDYDNPPVVTDTEIEMMLYAWVTNTYQGFVDGFLGAESQAFFH